MGLQKKKSFFLTEILECFQSKILSMIADAPRHVPNTVVQRVSKHQQLKKNSIITALNMVRTSVYTQTT
jgi:hypothetical protein